MDNDSPTNGFVEQRRLMVERDLVGRDIVDPGVLAVMGQVRREEFLPAKYGPMAYADEPLPVGMGQTISQPYIVALMTQLLRLNSYCEVLEIGTGSGYQTAILSKLAKKVWTIERFGQLSESAQAALGRGGFENIEFCVGDGSAGWPGQMEFDRIIVTAGMPDIPEPLIDQLKLGGLIVAPVGGELVQKLIVLKKQAVGTTEKYICDVRFVKLIGEYGFDQ